MRSDIQTNHLHSSYHRIFSSHELSYHSNHAEGDCIMRQITPIRFVPWKFVAYLISNLFLLLPLLLTFRSQKYKRIFYYQFSSLQEATHIYILNLDQQATIVRKELRLFITGENSKEEMWCFVNRHLTYLVDENMTVRLALYDYKERLQKLTNPLIPEKGLTSEQVCHLRDSYGPGTMLIPKPTVSQLLTQQILNPLYILVILGAAFLIAVQEYYYYGIALLFFLVLGVFMILQQMLQLHEHIFKMAYYEVTVNVLRDGQVNALSSREIVPGDIVFLKDPTKVAFQGIILEGSALINQCTLTGQSVPVLKKAERFDRVHNNPTKVDKSAFVYEGTTILQINRMNKMIKYEPFRKDYGIPVFVIRTNFLTTRGQLIRNILFPGQQPNPFQTSAMKFLLFILVLAIIGYSSVVAINWQYESIQDLIINFLDTILIALPIALPVNINFIIIFALENLKKKSIFCSAVSKLTTGGTIQLACFDKTGTLTENQMDLYCLVPSYQSKFHTNIVNTPQMSTYIVENHDKKPYYLPLLNNMACNHSIITIEGYDQLIGDPMEIQLFNFGRFKFDEAPFNKEAIFSFSSPHGHRGVVYRKYEFQFQLERMSVVAETSVTRNLQVFVKGSPEAMLQLMKSSSIPRNFGQVLRQYTSRGFRVLAVASKSISQEQVRKASRQEIESQLVFNGFEVFENKLKPQTRAAIEELKKAEINCVMVTGDNALTASHISYKCSISKKEKGLIIVDFASKRLSQEVFLFHDYQNAKDFHAFRPNAQSYIEDGSNKTENSKDYSSSKTSEQKVEAFRHQFQPSKVTKEDFMFNLVYKAEENDCQLCVTGRAFNELFSGPVQGYTDIHRRFMQLSRVFARAKPRDKTKIIMVYQKLGKRVSMCGDGANDCGALKQADIGLSLCTSETSISAPFSSQVTNILAMVELIKECRASLATNFSLFNIMAIYALIQFTATQLSQLFLQQSPDFQFLYWDLILNLLPVIFFGYSAAAQTLSIQKPRSSLFSLTNILQLLIVFFIQAGGQILTILVFAWVQPDYYSQYGGFQNSKTNYETNQNNFIQDGLQTNAIFLFINNVLLISIFAFNICQPWRKPFWRNLPFMIVTFIAFATNIVINMVPGVGQLFSLKHLTSFKLRSYLLATSLVFSIIIYIVQKHVLEPAANRIVKKYHRIPWV